MSGPPCLQSIILNAHNLYASIRGYFVYKDENGYSSVGKPVLDKAVLEILHKRLIGKDGDDQAEEQSRFVVRYVVTCLLEFSSNTTEQEPWLAHTVTIADLIDRCIDICVNIGVKKYRDDRMIEVMKKLCEVVNFAAEQSEEMCNRLLRKSARNLFQMMDLVASRPLRLQNFLTSNVLLALSSLCFHAKRSCVREAFEDHKLHLNEIGEAIVKYDIDSQLSAFIILSKSVEDNDEASSKAAGWFKSHPSLQDKFVQCYALPLSKGSGDFLDKLNNVKSARL